MRQEGSFSAQSVILNKKDIALVFQKGRDSFLDGIPWPWG